MGSAAEIPAERFIDLSSVTGVGQSEFITGSGKVIGLPDLRPSDNLSLSGLGKRFNGLYYVKKVEHTMGGSGYTTQFDVRKTYDGGLEA